MKGEAIETKFAPIFCCVINLITVSYLSQSTAKGLSDATELVEQPLRTARHYHKIVNGKHILLSFSKGAKLITYITHCTHYPSSQWLRAPS